MPKREDIKSIMIIGSGPIIIGQACEFDYSGTQACKALKDLGYKVILVNSNPATIMTDPEIADRTYIEPIDWENVGEIIKRERPDALLPTLGGQTSLNTAIDLWENGILQKYNVELIGADVEVIKTAEDRELFKTAMEDIGLDLPRGGFARDKKTAYDIAEEIGFPIIIRPSFTLGGMGGSIAYNKEEFKEYIKWGLRSSPIGEVLIEESVLGWKEFELEVMRDKKDNVVIVCSIENLDPMGVHTGDSITVAPAQTLTDKEYELMRDAAIKIIRKIGVDTGGSNIQFALHPETGRMVIIEMNPRVSRSSALASKATGYPIAKIAAKLSVGLNLDEIPNDITSKTPASFEPVLDYVVVKIPRWAFEKFPEANAVLNTQMKSVGEAMSIGRTFKEALQKGLRSLEIDRFGLGSDDKDVKEIKKIRQKDGFISRDKVLEKLRIPNPDRIFFIRYALKCGFRPEEICEESKIDPWFVAHIRQIVELENELINISGKGLPDYDYCLKAKKYGFSDVQLAKIFDVSELEFRAHRKKLGINAVFKTVDTCSSEFEADTPYYYSTYENENEAVRNDKKKIVIIGSGPNRIGQGIEFDYCCVHGVMALRELGFEAIMINSNPETVSTDYDTSDKLYFEPLTFEDVMNIIEFEQPDGIIVQFGGQTPLNLAIRLEQAGAKIIGTSPASIDMAEDRELFDKLLSRLGIREPENGIATSFDEASEIALKIGYPVLVRPSYVLGGRAMEIVYDEEQLKKYIVEAVEASPEHPILIDDFLEDAFEFDVDAVSDGEITVIGGIMQHIEEAGIHSGDSSCTLPPYMLTDELENYISETTKILARELKVLGLINIQFAEKDGKVYVLEVNPRASRTVPFVSKSIGVPLAKIAAKIMAGKTLNELGFTKEIPVMHVSIKEAVFPFNKFSTTNHFLGPEMKSTGEVMGIGTGFGTSFYKAQRSLGISLPLDGTVFISVNDNDKPRGLNIARDLAELGFDIIATKGTAAYFNSRGVRAKRIYKANESRPNIVDLMKNNEVGLIINTPFGKLSRQDEYYIGRNAILLEIPMFTTLSGAWAAVKGIMARKNRMLPVKSLQEYHDNLNGL